MKEMSSRWSIRTLPPATRSSSSGPTPIDVRSIRNALVNARTHLWSTDFLPELMLGLENLRAHKLRSLLTMLGMIFGVAAVVAMLSIGAGAQQEVMAFIEQLGVRNLIVEAREAADEQALQKVRQLSEGLSFKDLRVIRGEPRQHQRRQRPQAIHADQASAAADRRRHAGRLRRQPLRTRPIGNLRIAVRPVLRRRGGGRSGAGGGPWRSCRRDPVWRRRSGRPLRQGQRAVVPGDWHCRSAGHGSSRRRRTPRAGSQQPDLRSVVFVSLPARGRAELRRETRSTACTCR